MAALTVLDTDVLVDHFRGVDEAKTFIEGVPINARTTTDVSYMELLCGVDNQREQDQVDRFITHNFPHILPISATVSRQARELLRQHRLSRGLSLPDALIAAIVLSVEGTLITGNQKHFASIPDLNVQLPSYRTD